MQHVSTAPANALGIAPIIILVAWGTLLWAIGVLILRWLVSIDGLQGLPHLLAYTLTVAGTIPLIRITPRLAGLSRHDTVGAIAMVSMTALLIDGVVIGYIPWVYSADPAQARGCAGALLWGVGVALALAWVMQPRRD